jgi:hypothetical protein
MWFEGIIYILNKQIFVIYYFQVKKINYNMDQKNYWSQVTIVMTYLL